MISGQLVVYRLLNLYINPTMSLAMYVLPFLTLLALFAASYTRGFTKLVRRDQERSERTGQWERLVLDESC